MRCPFCGCKKDKVVDSRESSEGNIIRRRRQCLKCHKRFTTYEQVERVSLMVIKKDGRREPFNRQKVINGLVKACQKRPISIKQIEEVVASIELELQRKFETEVKSDFIGELVIKKLINFDSVAYVRFASVYREFKDVNQFMQELKDVLKRK
jgi:transcriptional repressor NrdR